MQGTFEPGDYLLLAPVAFSDVHPGDVIVYRVKRENGDNEEVVHRVVAITKDGLIVRGDNKLRCDSLFIQPGQFIGKVEFVENKGRKQPVLGGLKGLQKAKLRWKMLWLDIWFRRIFRNPYHLLRNSRVVSKLWHPVIYKMYLHDADGLLVKYIYKQRTVATWDPSQKKYDCRKPFDLVISPPEESR